MNKFTFTTIILFLTISYQLLAQNVGIGTNTPTEKLHVVGGGTYY